MNRRPTPPAASRPHRAAAPRREAPQDLCQYAGRVLRVVNIASDCGYTPWSFHKYLIDRQGRVAAVFPSQIDPLDRRITGRVEQLPEGR